MKRFGVIIFICLLVFGLFLWSSTEVWAQIVPAGTNNYSPEGYGTCEAVDLANNVIKFLFGMASLFAVIVFVYAGFLMVSSRGDAGQVQKAKGMFTNVIIGFVIMLAAFLIVNTVLGILLGTGSKALHWQTLECSYAYKAGEASFDVTLTKDEVSVILASLDPLLVEATAGACDGELIDNVWGAQSAAAKCIIKNESACGATPISVTDISKVDRNPFSFGAMQINTTVHVVRGCTWLGIPDLDCKDAWSGKNYNARVVNQALYKQCRDALLNPACNMINGKRIYKESNNSWKPWSTAKGCKLL